MLVNYTDQAIGNIKDSPDRADAARELARSRGAEMKDLWLTMGGYDTVCTVEADSNQAAAQARACHWFGGQRAHHHLESHQVARIQGYRRLAAVTGPRPDLAPEARPVSQNRVRNS
jgi:hypothetical protein